MYPRKNRFDWKHTKGVKKYESSQEFRAELERRDAHCTALSLHSSTLHSTEDGRMTGSQEARPRFLVDPMVAAVCISGVNATESVSVGVSL